MGTTELAAVRGLAVPRVWLSRALVFAVLVSVGLWLTSLIGGEANPSLTTRWLFAWQDDLARRALVGTILHAATGGTPTEQMVVAAASVVQVGTIVAMAAAAAALTVGRDGRIGYVRGALTAGVMMSAAGLPAAAAGLGRLDQLLIILALLAGWAIVSDRPWVAGGLLMVATLVHEAAIVMVGVWLAVLAWNRRGQLRDAAVVLGPSLLAGLAVSLHRPTGTPGALAYDLAGRTGVAIDPAPIAFEWYGLTENIAYTVSWVGGVGTALAVGSIVAAIPVLLLCAVALTRGRSIWLEVAAGQWRLLVASLAPLVLCLVAVDWARWAMFSVLLMTVSTLMILRDRDDRRPSLAIVAAAVLAAWMVVQTGALESHAFLKLVV